MGEALFSPSFLCSRPTAAATIGPMAGYSGTPLPRKLGLKPGARLGLVERAGRLRAHAGRAAARRRRQGGVGRQDAVRRDRLLRAHHGRGGAAAARRSSGGCDPAGGLWMAWPRRRRPASGVATDVSENDVRAIGLAAGLVDNKVCAIDDVWSGLRFVFRLVDRPSDDPSRRHADRQRFRTASRSMNMKMAGRSLARRRRLGAALVVLAIGRLRRRRSGADVGPPGAARARLRRPVLLEDAHADVHARHGRPVAAGAAGPVRVAARRAGAVAGARRHRLGVSQPLAGVAGRRSAADRHRSTNGCTTSATGSRRTYLTDFGSWTGGGSPDGGASRASALRAARDDRDALGRARVREADAGERRHDCRRAPARAARVQGPRRHARSAPSSSSGPIWRCWCGRRRPTADVVGVQRMDASTGALTDLIAPTPASEWVGVAGFCSDAQAPGTCGFFGTMGCSIDEPACADGHAPPCLVLYGEGRSG